jgi:hypothetical protein
VLLPSEERNPACCAGLVTVASTGGAGHEVACDSQHQQSRPGATRRSKINSSDPPLTAVCAAHAAPPLPPFAHPPVELASFRPRGRLHLDRWIDFSAICCVPPLQVGIAELVQSSCCGRAEPRHSSGAVGAHGRVAPPESAPPASRTLAPLGALPVLVTLAVFKPWGQTRFQRH